MYLTSRFRCICIKLRVQQNVLFCASFFFSRTRRQHGLMESEVADLEPPHPLEDALQPQHVSCTAMSRHYFLPIVIMSPNEREISLLNDLITTHTQLTLLLFQERHYEDIQREYKVHKYLYLIPESECDRSRLLNIHLYAFTLRKAF